MRARISVAIASLLVPAALLLAPAEVRAGPDCVTPKAKVVPGKGLDRTWIPVFDKPDPRASPIWIKIASPLSLIVTDRRGGYLQLTTTNQADAPFKPDIVLGWVRALDIQFEPFRNCTP